MAATICSRAVRRVTSLWVRARAGLYGRQGAEINGENLYQIAYGTKHVSATEAIPEGPRSS
jgi:hypothetical protein